MDEEEELENTLIGQEQEAPGVNTGDVMMGGLGLGGAAYAAQTGRVPTTPPSGSLSPFAQQVAANDAARLAAQNRPVVVGTGTSTSGVTNPRLIPETRLVPETRLATTTNPLATTSTGTPPKGQPQLTGPTRLSADDFDYRIGGNKPKLKIPSAVTNLASGLVRGAGPSAFLTPTELGRAEVFPTGMNATLFEDADGNISLVPKEGFFPITGDRPSIAMLKAEQEAETPAFTNTIAEIVAQKNARGPGSSYTKEELDAISGFLKDVNEDTAQREKNIVNNQVELAKQIRELDTVSDDQREVQEFLNEQAERLEIPATDVITPFQEQAQTTADLFTDPDTEIGQFVPRATFTLPDGTIIQEDEGGNRREISAEQLEQFERDMFDLGQRGVLGLGEGGDRGVLQDVFLDAPTRPRPMGREETIARLGGRTLNEYLSAPPVRTPGISGLKTDPQGRMIPNQPRPTTPETVTPQPTTPETVTPEPVTPEVQQPVNETPVATQPASALSDFERESLAREARLAERDRLPGETQTQRDTRLAQSRTDRDTRLAQSRTQGSSQGGLSQADARDLAQGTAKDATEGERMRALQIQSRLGLGQFKPEQTELQKDFTQRRIALMDEQLAQSGIVPSEPPVVDPETGVITQKYTDGTTRYKGVARNPNTGVIDPNFSGFLPDQGDKSSDTVRMTDRDGNLRDVPKSDVQEALKNGYKNVGSDFVPNM